MNTVVGRFTTSIAFLIFVLFSHTCANVQVDVDTEKSNDLDVMKKSHSSIQSTGDNDDDSWREKRPGGRFMTSFANHQLAKRPGARFVSSLGDFGGGGFRFKKRPDDEYFDDDTGDRMKRPGGRYYGYYGDTYKRLGGRYGFSNRFKKAGGRYVSSGQHYSFFGGRRHQYGGR